MKTSESVRAVIAAAFFLAAVRLYAAGTVEQWGVFELALNGPTNGNPFLDAQFSGRFTQGAEATEVNGFYDGDGVYRRGQPIAWFVL